MERCARGQSVESESSSQGIQRFLKKLLDMQVPDNSTTSPDRKTSEDRGPPQWLSSHSTLRLGHEEGTTRQGKLKKDISLIFQAGKDVSAIQPVRREPLVARKSGGESAGAARRSTSASIDSGEIAQTWGWG